VPTYRLELEYAGAAFHGWQTQPCQRTVQGVLAAALSRLCPDQPVPEGAGRTDSGVHALGQVASFVSARDFEPLRLLRALGGLLPADVRVYRAGRASDGFSARRSAQARLYRYQWLRTASALLGRYHGVLPRGVLVQRMQEAAELLCGDHDFTAFAVAASGGGRCCVRAARVVETATRLAFEIEADRFLHNMVRRSAGALCEVGRGALALEAFAARFARRAPLGPCLPARGLYLVAVRYPSDPVYAATAVTSAPPLPPWE
jgi:tRNA pseudouridine38-40 synthase